MKRLSILLLPLTACVVHSYQPSPGPQPLPHAPTSAGDLSAAPQQLEIRGTIAFDETVTGPTPVDSGAAAVYAFAARGGSQIQLELDRLVQGVEVTLYGPIRSGEQEAVTPIARGDGPHIVAEDGTYVVGVNGPGGTIEFRLSLRCPSGSCALECGADNSCPTGSGCGLVSCADPETPCPQYCEPFRGESGTAPGALGDLCGTRGAAECQAGMYCMFISGSGCGATDTGGRCTAVPVECAQEYVPVCGCDDQTYPNRCAAAANGVSVQRDGACPT